MFLCSYIVSYIAEALVGNHSQLDNKQLICNNIWVCIYLSWLLVAVHKFSRNYHLTGEWDNSNLPARYNVLFTLRPLFLAGYIKADVFIRHSYISPCPLSVNNLTTHQRSCMYDTATAGIITSEASAITSEALLIRQVSGQHTKRAGNSNSKSSLPNLHISSRCLGLVLTYSQQ